MHNDKRFNELEDLESWQPVNEEQDIRGCPVLSITGECYGKVDELLVDKDNEHVAAVRLDDGRMVPVENLELRDRDVIYHDDTAASRIDYAPVRRRP